MDTCSPGRSKSSSNARALKFTTFQLNLSQAKPSLRSCKLKVKNSQSKCFERLLNDRKKINKSLSKKNEKLSAEKLGKTAFSDFFQKSDEKLQETIRGLQLEVKKLKQENFDLKEEVRSLTRDSRESFVAAKIFAGCFQNLIDIQEFWHIVNPNDLELVTSQQLKRGVRALGIQLKEKKLDLFFQRLSQGSAGVSQGEFLNRVNQLKPSFVVTLADLEEVLKTLKDHLKNSKNQLDDLFSKTFKQQKISLKEALKGFKKMFSDVCEDSLEKLALGVFSFESHLCSSEILKSLKRILNN